MHYSVKELFGFMLLWMFIGAMFMYFAMHILRVYGINF
jgi:hypothetical protein